MKHLLQQGSFVLLAMSAAAMAQNYAIAWYTIDGGGFISSNGGNYSLGGSIGQADAGTTMTGGAYTLAGGFWPGASDEGCTNVEKVKKASCRNRNGSNQLKVSLTNGRPGDTFVVELTDASSKSGTLNNKGKGKAKFNDRPPGDTGTATATWGCGATDAKTYSCP